MSSRLWSQFVSVPNLQLAFDRISLGGNREYKNFSRHLLPAYRLARDANLRDLSNDLRRHRYEPEVPIRVFQPKTSGVLRPLTLLSQTDQIVYQAVGNIVAERFEERQQRYAYDRCFGAIFAGAASPFFYRPWKRSYSQYNSAIGRAYGRGARWFADFDLVSFYDLIDHNLLRRVLAKRVNSPELLDLLFLCLQSWTPRAAGAPVHHGIPQGPEFSAFLAECFLFFLDRGSYPRVTYLRYVDDIKLLGHKEVPVRRSLIRLDLRSKTLGLVPQAQKISCQKITRLADIRKTVPSTLIDVVRRAPRKKATVSKLLSVFRKSLTQKRPPEVSDRTHFRFALARLPPLRSVLRRISPLLATRPDISGILASYIARFGMDPEAAGLLATALGQAPVFEAAAANFVRALDLCAPMRAGKATYSAVKVACARSVEQTGLLRLACNIFLGRRTSAAAAAELVKRERQPLFRSALLHSLIEHPRAPFKVDAFRDSLMEGLLSEDGDFARYCGTVLATNGMWPSAKELAKSNRAVRLLGLALGVRKRAPRANNALSIYFQKKMRIGIRLSWKAALGPGYRDAEMRCIRLQRLEGGDPTAWVLLLDTFNEALIQSLSAQHPALSSEFVKGIRKGKVLPDFGWWLHQPALQKILPKGIGWYQRVHSVRVKADLAHAKDQKTGVPTRAVSFPTRNGLNRARPIAWAELISEFDKLI